MIIRLLCLLFFPISLFGWWDLAHMAVAKIAYDRLTDEAKEQVEALSFHPDWPQSNSFLTSACWADDVRVESKLFQHMHGCSMPYDPEQILSPAEAAVICARAEQSSILSAIEASLATLSNPEASPTMKTLSLRLLIHFLGDLHQPLHVAALYSSQFPNGDKGGALFPIDSNYCQNLHAYWDSMCGLCVKRLDRPLDHEGEKEICALAALCTHFPYQQDMTEGTLQDWLAGVQAWVPVVYGGIEPEKAPSSDYEGIGQQICMQQVALAGYRLAYLLNKLF